MAKTQTDLQAEVERLKRVELEWQANCPGCVTPQDARLFIDDLLDNRAANQAFIQDASGQVSEMHSRLAQLAGGMTDNLKTIPISPPPRWLTEAVEELEGIRAQANQLFQQLFGTLPAGEPEADAAPPSDEKVTLAQPAFDEEQPE